MQNDNNKRTIRRIGANSGDPHSPSQESADQQQYSPAAVQAADEAYAHQAAREAQKSPQPQPPSKKKRKMSTAKRIVLICIAALVVIGGAIIGKFIYDINHPAALFQENPTPTPTLTPSVTPAGSTPNALPTPEPTPDPEALLLSQADLEFMKNRVNILVLGLDESTERANWGSFRTDTMILVTIDFDTNDVDMISIPRDSYVKIANSSGKPTGGFGKINSAFPSGGGAQKNGFGYALGTVSYLLGGLPIQYYVGFDMNVVKEVVNAMGGVDYDVDIQVRMNGRTLEPGLQHMDGQAVLDYSRQRKGSSDIARVERQQKILKAIFRQLKSTDQIGNIPQIYTAVEQNIQTNLSFSQICALALMATNMQDEQLQSHTLDGEFLNIYRTSYWGLHTDKIKNMLNEIFGISVSIDSDLSASNVKARVQENRQLIAAELDAANSAINTANHIIGNYSAWIDPNVLSQLKSAKSQLEDAVDSEDKAQLDAYTPPLQSLNNAILSALQAQGVTIDSGGNENTAPDPEPLPEIPDVQIPDVPIG